MELMRSTWTDSRLDDLTGRVGEIRDEMREIRGEIGGLHRTMIHVGGGVIGTLVVGLLGLVATQL